MPRNLWTRDQLIAVLNLYLKMSFGQMHSRNPDVIKLANLIGRNANAVAIRLTNYAHVDPYHQARSVKGMSGGVKQVRPIWDEFINNRSELLFESERILAEKENQTVEIKYAKILRNIEGLRGETRLSQVKVRVNQNVFREIVLTNYSSKCAVSGIDISSLLVASHILPWSSNENERLNPENGICLSSLYDCAFDNGLIGINTDYKILLSSSLKEKTHKDYYDNFFGKYEGSSINLPERYLPSKEFLDIHLNECFIP